MKEEVVETGDFIYSETTDYNAVTYKVFIWKRQHLFCYHLSCETLLNSALALGQCLNMGGPHVTENADFLLYYYSAI